MFSLLFSVPIIAENRPAVNGSGLKEENRPAVPGGGMRFVVPDQIFWM
jgi:hypothetical protein